MKEPTDEEPKWYSKLISFDTTESVHETFRERWKSDFGQLVGKRNECCPCENSHQNSINGGSQPMAPFYSILLEISAVSVSDSKFPDNRFTPKWKYSVGKLFGRIQTC